MDKLQCYELIIVFSQSESPIEATMKNGILGSWWG